MHSLMADYNGTLLFDPEDVNAEWYANYDIVHSKIRAVDAEAYSGGAVAPVAASSLTVTPKSLPSPLPTLLLYNWSDGIQLTSAYQVDVLRASTVGEERRLLAGRPNRSQTVRWTGMSQHEMTRALMNLFRHGDTQVPIPLYSDHSRVTSAALKEIFCETAYRRFFAGQRFVICDFDENSRPQNVEWGVIDNVASTHIVPTVNLTNTYTDRARVYPMIDAELVFRDAASLVNDELGQLVLRVREIPGPSTLPPTASGNPSGWATYGDWPIFDATPEASFGFRPGMLRAGTQTQQGRGHVVYKMGDRPQATHSLLYRKLTRATVWPLIQFFDSRRGRLRPFWFVSPQALWNPVSIAADQIVLEGNGNIDDVENYFSYIALVERDGTVTIRGIDNVVPSGDNFRVDFDEVLTSVPAIADLRRTTAAHLMRFEKNSMTEEWTTDGICDIEFEMIELLREIEVTVLCLQ
jgi:hypothetical protein